MYKCFSDNPKWMFQISKRKVTAIMCYLQIAKENEPFGLANRFQYSIECSYSATL